jgi:hypothetical protein
MRVFAVSCCLSNATVDPTPTRLDQSVVLEVILMHATADHLNAKCLRIRPRTVVVVAAVAAVRHSRIHTETVDHLHQLRHQHLLSI